MTVLCLLNGICVQNIIRMKCADRRWIDRSERTIIIKHQFVCTYEKTSQLASHTQNTAQRVVEWDVPAKQSLFVRSYSYLMNHQEKPYRRIYTHCVVAARSTTWITRTASSCGDRDLRVGVFFLSVWLAAIRRVNIWKRDTHIEIFVILTMLTTDVIDI